MPGCEYYTHQDWQGVVAVFKPGGNAIITVRVEQPAADDDDKLVRLRREAPYKVAARATFRKDRRINAET